MRPGSWETRNETTVIVQANNDGSWEQGQAVGWGKGERVRFWIYLLEGRVSRIANVLDMTERRGIKDWGVRRIEAFWDNLKEPIAKTWNSLISNVDTVFHYYNMSLYSVQFSCSVMSDSLRPHGL